MLDLIVTRRDKVIAEGNNPYGPLAGCSIWNHLSITEIKEFNGHTDLSIKSPLPLEDLLFFVRPAVETDQSEK